MGQLLDSYQVPGVVDICPECVKWANKCKSAMLLEIAARMRAGDQLLRSRRLTPTLEK
jgi:hypothetical protein